MASPNFVVAYNGELVNLTNVKTLKVDKIPDEDGNPVYVIVTDDGRQISRYFKVQEKAFGALHQFCRNAGGSLFFKPKDFGKKGPKEPQPTEPLCGQDVGEDVQPPVETETAAEKNAPPLL